MATDDKTTTKVKAGRPRTAEGKLISGRVPDDVLAAAEERAFREKRIKSNSALVSEALAAYAAGK